MKKLYLFAATLAAAAAMSSCSEKDVVEQITEPVAKGEPFGVTATLDNVTRGENFADVDVTSTSLSAFRMSGLPTGVASSTGNFFNGKDGSNADVGMNTRPFQKQGNVWTDGYTYTWDTNSYDFYAVGNNSGSRSPFITPLKTATAEGGGTQQVDAGDIDDGSEVISFPSFTYYLPTNVTNQEDLIVAGKIGQSSGDVSLRFKHALAKIKVQAVYRESFAISEVGGINAYTDVEVHTLIKQVKFHGLATKGNFTFDPDKLQDANAADYGTWSDQDHSGTITMDFGDNPIFIVSSDASSYDETKYDDHKMCDATNDKTAATELGYIYAIPEALTNMTKSWNYVNGKKVIAIGQDDTAVPDNGTVTEDNYRGTENRAYVEIVCCMVALPKNKGTNVNPKFPWNDGETEEEGYDEDDDVSTTGPLQWLAYDFDNEDPDSQGQNTRYFQFGSGDETLTVYDPEEFENVEIHKLGYGTLYLPLDFQYASVGLDFNGNYVLTLNLQRTSRLDATNATYNSSFPGANAGL